MSGPNKFGRGPGRGVNRMVRVPPPMGRGMVSLGRGMSAGKDKGRGDEAGLKGRGMKMTGGAIGANTTGRSCQEEKFELVTCREQAAPPLFAMAVRLTPGLLETLKRGEELGETASIKFGPPNSGANVIKVSGEEFKFVLATEPGHLCDIYEEQRRGDDGNGLLVESGAVWRKLSVTRTLSATDKNRVKARSAEAEQQKNHRKAIILDHNNANLINKQAAAASVEVSGRRAPMMKAKKEPPAKKAKLTTGAPGAPSFSAPKSRPHPTIAEKTPAPAVAAKASKPVVAASSPELLPVGPSRATAPSSQGASAASMPPLKPKGAAAAAVEEASASVPPKPTTAASQRDKASSPALTPLGGGGGGDAGKIPKTSSAGIVSNSELRNCLITLLTDNPKGMTIKAVEKALGEALPNVRPNKKQIEIVIKAIASYHAPGKYMLKNGVEKGAFTKPSPGSASSLETGPVDSPPLADSPALMEGVPEVQVPGGNVHSGHGDGGERSQPQPPQESKKIDGIGYRTTPIPGRRGTESPMHRAIRRATEISRGNADKLQQTGHQGDSAAGIAVGLESPGRHRHPTKAEEDLSSVREGTIPQETAAEGDHVSIGGDESPLVDSPPDNAHERKLNGGEEEGRHVEDNPNATHSQAASPRSPHGGSDSSSGSSGSSGSESDSESESASSRSGTASDTDSDASSSSPSDEEKKVVEINMAEAVMDEDVDIMSSDDDDEDGKAVMDLEATPKHQKPKSKELQHEAKIQKQLSRDWLTKKQRQKDADASEAVAMTYRSGDADNDEEKAEGRGQRKGDVWEEQDGSVAGRGLKDYNSDEEVDVVDEEDTPLEKQGLASPAESGKHIGDGAGEEDAENDGNDDAVDVNLVEVVKDHAGQDDDPQALVGAKSGSESDHSIEEYETRAETSGVRGAKVKVVGDQKAEVGQQQQESRVADGMEGFPSPRNGEGINGSTDLTVENVSAGGKQSRTDGGGLGTVGKGLLSNNNKSHKASSGASLRQPSGERSSLLGPPPGTIHGTSQVAGGGAVGGGGPRMGREPSNKDKAIESKKWDGESSVGGRVGGKAVADAGQIQDRGLAGHSQRGLAQRSSKTGFDNTARSGKAASNALQVPNGLSRSREVPGVTTAKGLDAREEALTADHMVKSISKEGEAVDRLDVQQRRPNSREAGPPLSKPGKGSAGLPGRDQNSGRGQSKGATPPNLAAGGRPGKNPKQVKKAGLGRGDVLERVSGGPSHEVGVDIGGPVHQRRPSRDWETHRKSSPQRGAAEAGSRVEDDNESQQNANRVAEFQKADTDRSEATSAGVLAATVSNSGKVRPRMAPDSEQLNELRDLVAGDDLRMRDSSVRSEKVRESSDMPLSRPPPPPPPHRAHISPDPERPGPGKAFGKPGDVKKRSPAVRNVPPQKPDVPIPSRENVRPPAVNASSKLGPGGGGHDDRLEFGSNRPVEGVVKGRAVPVVGDNHEKAPPAAVEGSRIRKRPAEEGGDHDPGRPTKRVAVASDAHDASTAVGRGESDVGAVAASNKQERGSSAPEGPGRGSSVDAVKRISTEGSLNSNQKAVNHAKAVGENGRVVGAKTKGHDILPDNNKEVAEKQQRGPLVQQKATTTAAGLLGPGLKKGMQSNGRKRPPPRNDLQGTEFFAKYEKRHAEQKGPISTYDQYLDYCKEYQEKYQVYVTLHTHLDTDKGDFVNFSKAISSAKAAEDKDLLAAIYMNVTSNYVQSHKRFKRMRTTFNVLHEELKALKQRCKEYADKTTPS